MCPDRFAPRRGTARDSQFQVKPEITPPPTPATPGTATLRSNFSLPCPILPYFETLHGSLSIPVLYVSHDISEIERLADYMALLDSGRVVAAGPLSELLSDSRLPIARSPEASTVLEAIVGSFDARDCLTALDVDGETLLVPTRVGASGDTHRVRIAATDVSLAAAPRH